MPDVSELNEFIVAGSDIKDGEEMTILNEGEFVTFNAGKENERKSLQVKVKTPEGMTKKWTVNKTSLIELQGAWGRDSKAWIGKIVSVEVVKVNTPAGPKKTIIAHPKGYNQPGEIRVDEEGM